MPLEPPNRPDREPAEDRLTALEARLAQRKGQEVQPSRDDKTFSQAEMGWRMVYEMVAGLGIGFGIGYGFDVLFGTQPWFMLVFTLFGLAAGIRVMLRTAQEMNAKRAAQDAAGERENGRG